MQSKLDWKVLKRNSDYESFKAFVFRVFGGGIFYFKKVDEMTKSKSVENVGPDLVLSLRKIIRPQARSNEDVDDILQTVLVKVLKDGKKVEAVKFFSWLQKVCRSTTIDFYRKQKRLSPLLEEHIAQLESSVDQEENDTPERLAKCMKPLMKKLSPEEAEILSMIELEGKSQTEVAKKMGLPYPSFKSKVQRARVKLKDIVLDCCEVDVDSSNKPINMKPRRPSC
jgi:RNA polymerase sigma-70 factor (ECF subfamily)